MPDIADVRLFVEKADAMLARPELISFSHLLAIQMTYEEHGKRIASPAITYAGLAPDQRCAMHKYEKRMVDAISSYLGFRSRLSVCFWLATQLARKSRRVRRATRTPGTRQLAREFTRTKDAGALQLA